MTIINQSQSDPLKYTVTIVPRFRVNSMVVTIREKMNNVTSNHTCTTVNKNGTSTVTINDFVPIANAKYEMIAVYNNTIIWQGQIMLQA